MRTRITGLLVVMLSASIGVSAAPKQVKTRIILHTNPNWAAHPTTEPACLATTVTKVIKLAAAAGSLDTIRWHIENDNGDGDQCQPFTDGHVTISLDFHSDPKVPNGVTLTPLNGDHIDGT